MDPTVGKMHGNRGFSIIDYLIFAFVLLVSLAIGLYYAFTGGKQKTAGEFLMGNRKLKTVPVAMSILVSYVSAILVLGTPAEMYTLGTLLLLRTVGYCFACIISSLLFVPLFYKINVTSSFEYLQRRFNSIVVKLFGTVMMLIGNIFYMGLVMYSPSTALHAVTGFPLIGSIIITGVISAIYTALGGMKAVVWTDAFQFVVMIGGMLAIVIQGCINVGGIKEVVRISYEGERINFLNFDPDPTQRLTFWSAIIGGTFHTLITFGVGQTSVQRYCSLPSLKKAQRSVFLNIPGLLMINILACLVGLVIYAHYSSIKCDPLAMKYISNSNQLVPYFVVDVLHYPGIPGIFLAVLFSGALSSMSSSLNAASAVTWEDLLKPCLHHLKEDHKVIVMKALVIIYSAMAMIVAFMADGLGQHVLWASISFTGATSGPSLGMFLLGLLFPCANAIGAIVGFLISTCLTLWIAVGAFFYRSYSKYLPMSTECCNITMETCYNQTDYTSSLSFLNMTEISANTSFSPQQPEQLTGIFRMYRLSFLWYSALGASVTVIIGLIVSALTGPQKSSELDSDLVSPFFDRLCCCLPESFRAKLRCGMQYEANMSLDTEVELKEDYSSKTLLNVGESGDTETLSENLDKSHNVMINIKL